MTARNVASSHLFRRDAALERRLRVQQCTSKGYHVPRGAIAITIDDGFFFPVRPVIFRREPILLVSIYVGRRIFFFRLPANFKLPNLGQIIRFLLLVYWYEVYKYE